MAAKIGLTSFVAETDDAFIRELIDILQLVETDMTIFFRKLANVKPDTECPKDLSVLSQAYYKSEEIPMSIKRMNNLNYIATSNHIHMLVVDTGEDVIPKSLQLIAGRTAQEYNIRKNRKGAF